MTMNNDNVLYLTNNNFKYIICTGEIDQFSDLKRFCGDAITIKYENATGVGDYWDIELYDCLKERNITVPNGYYIIEIPDNGFTLLSPLEVSNNFEKELYNFCKIADEGDIEKLCGKYITETNKEDSFIYDTSIGDPLTSTYKTFMRGFNEAEKFYKIK